MKTFKRMFLKLTVFENHIEIVEGMFPYRKKKSILLRNISDTQISQFTKSLIIRTNDGNTHKFSFGGMGKKARDAQAAIIERM